MAVHLVFLLCILNTVCFAKQLVHDAESIGASGLENGTHTDQTQGQARYCDTAHVCCWCVISINLRVDSWINSILIHQELYCLSLSLKSSKMDRLTTFLET